MDSINILIIGFGWVVKNVLKEINLFLLLNPDEVIYQSKKEEWIL